MSDPPNRRGRKSQPKVKEAPRSVRTRRAELAKMLIGGLGPRPPAAPQPASPAKPAPISAPAPEAPRSLPTLQSGAVGERTGPTVLVIDDDTAIRELVVRTLAKDHLVYQAVDGKTGLDVLRALGSVDLVLCDIEMPKVDGLDLARAVKADPNLRSVPIVFLTARGTVGDHVTGMEAGARAYLTKPFSVKELRLTVTRACRRGPARS
jgi:CheY-like chemotaxis protein